MAAPVSNQQRGALTGVKKNGISILVLSSLFPNNLWPNYGIFVEQRISAIAKTDRYALRVVAPVPYYPPVQFGWRQIYRRISRHEVIDSITVDHPRYLMIPKIAMAFQGMSLFASLVSGMRRLHRDCRFDLIDAHYVYPDGFAAVLLGRVLGLPVTVSARGSDINQFIHFPIIRRMVGFTLTRADHVIAVSEALRQSILALGVASEKVSVIANGVDLEKFPRIDRQTARAALGLEPGSKILLSIGGLNPVKGFDLLICAFGRLARQQANAHLRLVIVGDGPERSNLERLITEIGLQSQVRLVGTVAHGELYQWYCAADLFCLASVSEGRPNVILEAMACGVPVVATAVGGIPELLSDSSLGLLCSRDVDAMASQIKLALEKTWDPELIVTAARQHSWANTASDVTHVYDRMLSAGHS